MSRPFRTTTAILLVFTALNFAGCKTIYSDTYAWKRNHFVPLKTGPTEKDVLPPALAPAPSTDAPPPLPAGPAPAADGMAPAPVAPSTPAAPAIPGL